MLLIVRIFRKIFSKPLKYDSLSISRNTVFVLFLKCTKLIFLINKSSKISSALAKAISYINFFFIFLLDDVSIKSSSEN